MPPQISISEEEIIEIAFEIVRKEGSASLSARRIAQEMNCSTHPIYRAFQSMEALERAVIDKAKAFITSYLLVPGKTEHPSLNIGLQYLRFAKEEPELFKLLFMSGKVPIDFKTMAPTTALLERMREEPELKAMSEDTLERMLTELWIFSYGLVTLACLGGLEGSEEYMESLLRSVGHKIIVWEVLSANGTFAECMKQDAFGN